MEGCIFVVGIARVSARRWGHKHVSDRTRMRARGRGGEATEGGVLYGGRKRVLPHKTKYKICTKGAGHMFRRCRWWCKTMGSRDLGSLPAKHTSKSKGNMLDVAALGADDGAPLLLVCCQLAIVSILGKKHAYFSEKKPVCKSLYCPRRPPDFGQKWWHNKTGGASCSEGKAQRNDHCPKHYNLGSYPRDKCRMLDVVEVLVGNIVSQSGRILYSGVRGNQSGTLGNG